VGTKLKFRLSWPNNRKTYFPFGKQFTELLYILIVNNIATNIENILFYSMFQLCRKPPSSRKIN